MQALAVILNIITVLFSIILIYIIYCIIDLLVLKSKVKKGTINEMKGFHFNILRIIMKVKGALKASNKKKFYRAANKYSFIGIIVAFFCIVIIMVSVALFHVLQSFDTSVVSVATLLTNTILKEEDETPKVDSDYTENSWVPTKDKWRLEDKSEEYKNGNYAGIYKRPGKAEGPLAITLNDGSYFWYHQSSSCGACDYCGTWTSMTWGPNNKVEDRHLFGEDGCAVYSLAIAASNLKGTAITPKDILKTLGSSIDESSNDCATYMPYFNGRGMQGMYKLATRVGEEYGINVQIINSGSNFTSQVDEILNKGGYVWFWMKSDTVSDWTWHKSETHFIVIRGQDENGNYYCFDSVDSESSGFKLMNTPLPKSKLQSGMCGTVCIGMWVDRQFVSTRTWYGSAIGISKANGITPIGGGINLYNGLPWEYEEGTYVVDCESMLYDMIDYINTVSVEEVNIDLDWLQSKSRMLETSAGLKSNGDVRLQGENWTSIKYDNAATDRQHGIESYVDINGVRCVGVCVPPTVIDPTYNENFKPGGKWQTASTPSSSIYGYSTRRMACILKHRTTGEIIYLPCSSIDAKAHTFIGGIVQTNVLLLGGNADENGNIISYNIEISRDWSGTNPDNLLKETWTPAQLGYKLNSDLIDMVETPWSPAKMVDNIAEFWHVNDEAWDAICNDYQVKGYVVWPN